MRRSKAEDSALTAPHVIFDRPAVDWRKCRAASWPRAPVFLLERACEDIAERLAVVMRPFKVGAVVGALDGTLGRHLQGHSGLETLISLESASPLLARCPQPRVQWDGEALPLAEGSVDLAVSALTLHLVNDLPGVLAQVRRALRPDGLFLAAMLGGETLVELREAWLAAESEMCGGVSPRVIPFADVRDMGGLLQRAGFALPVADSDRVRVTYADPISLMREIKAMGASNALAERSRRPVTRGLLLRAAQVYRERFADPDGRVPATFEIITLTGWAPHDSQQKPLAPGSARHRLAEALGVEEQTLSASRES